MTSRKILLPILFLAIAVTSGFAQAGKLKYAKKLMDELNYTEAIATYNMILEKDDVAEAKINIAECYRKIGDSGNAEFWYGQVVRLPEAEPITKLYYGQMLQRNGKCEIAREWYNQYIEMVPDDLRGQYLARACDYEQELMSKNAGIFEIKHLDFNSDLDDMTPNYWNGTVVFASDRDMGAAVKREHTWTGHPFLELYYVEYKEMKASEDGTCGELVYARPEKFNKKINSKYHDAAITFPMNGKEIYFTRNNLNDGKVGKDDEGIIRLKVYSAKDLGEGNFGDLESLPFNSDEYSVTHPALSPDGNTLYFASDMPGGFGGMDLYLSKKESGRWGPPENLGPQVNTEGNEVFPFVDQTNRLYFSSDGLIGLGGLDIYYTKEKAPAEWSMPENLGYPINTVSDDFSIIFNKEGTCGYFTSDRTGGVGGDDLYSFRKTAAPVDILVYNESTGEPIEGAMVYDECTGRTLVTGVDGMVTIDMKLNTCCNFKASAEGFRDNEKEECTKNLDLGENLKVEIPLTPDMEFLIEGIVFDDGTGLPMADADVKLTNDCGAEDQMVTTDETGRFSFRLDKNCCFKVKGTKERYLADMAENLCTRGLEQTETFNVKLFLQPTIYTPTKPDLADNSNDKGGNDKGGNAGNGNNNTTDEPTQTAPDYNVYRSDKDGLFYLQETGELADGEVNGKTYEKGILVDAGENPDAFDQGPTEVAPGEPIAYLLHIYYDFDQSYIREDAKPEVEKLLKTLVENPEIIVEIGSHTDSRGSKNYNKRLSQRRADAVVRYLLKNGVERDRLLPVGYGESKTVNNCKDFIPCSERDHQLNRRTEFRIVGCKGCVDKDSELISKPNENVKVDECKGCPF
ncbi:MAG: OmpA family protein [Saprospiraceae bacterium]